MLVQLSLTQTANGNRNATPVACGDDSPNKKSSRYRKKANKCDRSRSGGCISPLIMLLCWCHDARYCQVSSLGLGSRQFQGKSRANLSLAWDSIYSYQAILLFLRENF